MRCNKIRYSILDSVLIFYELMMIRDEWNSRKRKDHKKYDRNVFEDELLLDPKEASLLHHTS